MMRYSYKKGGLWLLVYFLLAMIPIFIAYGWEIPAKREQWVEIGVAFGFLGLSVSALLVLFSGRFIKVAPDFGVDNLIQFHKETGVIAVLFCLVHPLILLISDPGYLVYFDPSVNFFRALALSSVLVAILLLFATSIWRLSFGLKYEYWRLAHGCFSFFLIFVGITHAFQVGHYMHSDWKKALYLIFFGGLVYLLVHSRLIRPWLNKKRKYEITEIKEERDESTTLTLKPKKGNRLIFQPGQFVWITIKPSPFSLQQHPFSISSGTESSSLDLTAKATGDFTSTWKSLEKGTLAYLEGPLGSFTLKDKPCFFIMGGIGVTPAMSFLKTLRSKNDQRPCTMILGNQEWDKIIFRENLDELKKDINLEVVHVLEDPEANWEGETGYIDQKLIKKYLPKEMDSFDYFICGPAPLMDTAEIALRNLGVDWRNIYAERFEMV